MKPARFTTVVIVALVALRLGCGWLFFREGSKKLDGGNFSSEGFLRDAKGPFAGAYLNMVPDPYGDLRLDYGYAEDEWKYYYSDTAAKHFDFDDNQLKQAEGAYHRALAKLKFFLETNGEEIDKNYREFDRVTVAMNEDPTAAVNYRRTWIEKQNKEINSELQGWLREVDGIWDEYENDIADIARVESEFEDGTTSSQYEIYGPKPLPKPGAGMLGAGFADSFIPWLTFGVGVLLVLGLFTRVAAIAGSLFLASVVLSQPPFVASASDVNYQIVLLLGLLVVAAVGAGQWGGLDFFLRWGWSKCCGRSNTVTQIESPKKA